MAITLVAVLSGCAAPPARRGRDRGIRTVQLTNTSGHLEYLVRSRRQNQVSKVGAGRTELDETVSEQRLGLKVDGYAYHPNLLEFSLGGLFGLLQQDTDQLFGSTRRSDAQDGDVLEFDLSGRFFKKKSYPGTVFARRNRALAPRAFQSSLETTTTSFGLSWQYVDEKTPSNIQFSRTAVDLEPLNDDEEPGSQRNTVFRLETAYIFSEQNALSLVFSRQSIKQEPFEFDYDTDELTLSHRLDFGDENEHRLDSEANFFTQRGSFSVDRGRLRETLRLKHTDNLRSWFVLEALDREQGSLAGVTPIDEQAYSVSGTLEHQLYESLTSQLSAFFQTQNFGEGLQIDRTGGSAVFDYRKKNRWGRLVAGYRVRLVEEDRGGGAQDFERIDERRTFRDPEPIVLNGTDIDVGAIRITPLNQITLYRRGEDYRIETFANRVEIRRMPTGRIADGETVLIDYVFTIGGSFVLDTVTHHLSVRQDFDFGLSPYYRLHQQDQTLSPATATQAVAEDITAHTIGAEFDAAAFRLTAEYEDHESNINPFTALRLSAGYTRRFGSGATGNLKARWTEVLHELPARETRFMTLEGRYRHPISRRLTVEGALRYRTEEDSLSGDDEGIEVDLSLEWIVRQTEVRVSYEFRDFEDDFAKNDSSGLYVHVKRKF